MESSHIETCETFLSYSAYLYVLCPHEGEKQKDHQKKESC